MFSAQLNDLQFQKISTDPTGNSEGWRVSNASNFKVKVLKTKSELEFPVQHGVGIRDQTKKPGEMVVIYS